ncbi:HXXEE domain-containing protein [Martelella limonii]|uniref:HXXEE domain-containing protein n=1 Tax=Martelella limonii TaxID=1647649 RepID=UPI0015807641|nr:HXXEE domain-containing protein [Martelella limonii]
MVAWLAKRWVVAALFMACGFTALLPAIALSTPLFATLIFLHLPVYMFHQVEEHSGDRFRHFANAQMFHGLEVLRPVDVLVVNLPVVWGVNLFAFYAALLSAPGAALVAPYLLIVNALLHAVTTVRLRCYNPGLVTALLLFLPLGVATLLVAFRVPGITIADHLIGLAAAVAIHVAIMAQSGWRYRHASGALK